jgi:1-aminocyclopropane-1-carboxylate deaminase
MQSSFNQTLQLPLLQSRGVTLMLKREDQLHPLMSGNKFRKLKYNLEAARLKKAHTLLTFGGAYSNHILATAAASAEHGFKSTGIIRGEELKNRIEENPTLSKAQSLGMKFIFVSRERYQELTRDEKKAKHLCAQDGIYMIPEGGSNALAVKGVAEMLTEEDLSADYLCCSVGTGATLAGLVEAARPQQQVLGFAALDHQNLAAEVGRFTKKSTYEIVHDYTFGGYAKVSDELIGCMNDWLKQTGVLFDPVYTAKMMYGILDRIRRGAIPKGSVILAVHTGGLQGIEGMNSRLEKKNAPLILTSCSKKAS